MDGGTSAAVLRLFEGFSVLLQAARAVDELFVLRT
jgi:hypothetical protein